MYHGTRLDYAKKILKEGIQPGTAAGTSGYHSAFTTEDKATALSYARSKATEEFSDLKPSKHAALVVLKPGAIVREHKDMFHGVVKGPISKDKISHVEVYKVSDIKKLDEKGTSIKPIRIIKQGK